MSDLNNYYQVLELNHDASLEEIKNSFRRLALRYHPDRNREPNSTQKFIKIVEAYEALCHEKVEKLNDFTELLIKPGSVSIETSDKYAFAKVTQGNAYFYGILRSSQNSQFLVVFRDGFGNSNRWINGKVYLIERDYLLWIKEFERPINAAVSDNGTIALLHTFKKDRLSSSSPKEFIDLGGTLTVIERSGKSLFTYEFGSNIQGCAISQNGNLVSVATLYPDNSIYCFDVERKTLSWRYPIHATKMPVLGLEFKGNQIDVFSGSNIATMGKKYTITIDGILLTEYEDKSDALKKIRKQPAQEKVNSLLAMVTSDNQEDVTEGLLQLVSFVKTKGAVPHYPKIVSTLGGLIQRENGQLEPIWKVLKQIMKREPERLNPVIDNIISQVKICDSNVTWVLMVLGELGGAKPSWLKGEERYIKQKLKSKSWNERRFAAFAIGNIGSADPCFVTDAIPVLIEYISDPEKVRNELNMEAQKELEFNKQLSVSPFLDLKISMSSCDIGMVGPFMLRDACIDAIGLIGKRFPDYVNNAIPLLEKLSVDAPSPYTIKKALHALDAIRG
jgi:curved DNA-binding protein CbpA